jgi:mannose-6-phosphate isomerase-like protein (cupin superfamily)
MGISIQVHKFRSETWEILEGKPIIINGNGVYYFIKNGTQFINTKNMFHSVINPNKNSDKYIKIKESWSGIFDENDIDRVYNPNEYY